MKFEPIFKRTKTGAIQTWQIEVEKNSYRTISGQKNGKQTISRWTICKSKNEGRANYVSSENQAKLQAERIRNRKLEKEYKLNINDIDTKNFVQNIQPMLAEKWTDNLNRFSSNTKLFVQPKLDGIRCIITRDGMFSRNGKPLVSAPHIFNSVKHLFDKYPNIIAYDGELYNHGLAEDFNKIISLAKKTKPTVNDLQESADLLQFWCYDIITLDKNASFSERLSNLTSIYNIEFKDINDIFVLVETFQCFKEDVEQYLENMLDQLFEGLIIRLDAPYEHRRTKSLLKYKRFIDCEFQIDDIEEGDGNRTGIAGNIVSHTTDGQTFHSNLKFDYDFCRELLLNKKKYIGKYCTIKFFQYTPAGIPRFPFVISIGREDYE